MEENDAILINGLEFYAYHGASDAEQAVGHRYVADVRLAMDTRAAGASDCLSDTVDYAMVARRIMEIGTQERFRLLEALAARICEAILAEFDLVEEIRLRIQKAYPPMNAIAATVGVEITRRRGEGK